MPQQTYLETVTQVLREETNGNGVSYVTLKKHVDSRRDKKCCEAWLRKALKAGVEKQVLEKRGSGYRLVLRVRDKDYVSADEARTLKQRAKRLLGWSEDRTEAVFRAYEQFLAIKAAAGDWDAKTLSPPHAVDEMWHLHVLDTKAYGPWSQRVFGRLLHHDPDGDIDRLRRDQRRASARDAIAQKFPAGTYDRGLWEFPYLPPKQRSGPPNAVNCRLRDQGGEETYFKMRSNMQFTIIGNAYANRKGLNLDSLRFLFEGQRVFLHQTPDDIGLEDCDQLDVMLEQQGC